MKYPGGKNSDGTYQFIINHIPPHETYIEGFLGSGAIIRYTFSSIPDLILGSHRHRHL
jgi:site-specific DNA-adenine methylase